MKRASSRQRLVSWDKFDASIHDDSSSEDDNNSSDCMTYINTNSLHHNNGGGRYSSFHRLSSDTALTTKNMKKYSSPILPSSKKDQETINIVPAFSHEIINNKRNNLTSKSVSITASSTGASIYDLMDDAQLHILSFVDIADTRSMLSTCKQYYHLLKVSEESYTLWMEYYSRLWPKTFLLSRQKCGDDNDDYNLKRTTSTSSTTTANITIRDDLEIPNQANDDTKSTNLSALIAMAAKAHPDDINSSKLSRRMYYLRRGRLAGTGVNVPFKTSFIYTDTKDGSKESYVQKTIQYTGPVGPGDRCIVSNQPFPKPKFVKPLYEYSFDSVNPRSPKLAPLDGSATQHSSKPSCDEELMAPYVNTKQHQHHRQIVELFSCSSKSHRGGRGDRDNNNGDKSNDIDAPTITPNNAIWRPFVVPYVTKNNTKTGEKEVNLTPRLVAYYEVTIHDKSALLEEGQHQTEQHTRSAVNNFANIEDGIHNPMQISQAHRQTFPDCVAIGISSNGFHLHSKMPGWDTLSYGYHGDDGGLFHGSGSMVKQGPSFGCGDTVGCGIDYVTGGIFFTLNGSFLGYGWSNIDPEFLQSDLYPTIGVDTNCPLSVNFGNERPFKFDLTRFIKRQEDIVKYCITPLTDSYDAIDNSGRSSCGRKPRLSLIKSKIKSMKNHHNGNEKRSGDEAQPCSPSPRMIRRKRLLHCRRN